MKKKHPKKKQQGVTFVEMMSATAITTMVVGSGAMLAIGSASSYKRGTNWIQSDDGSRLALSKVSRELRQAMSVKVENKGKTVTYKLPGLNADGSLKQPLVWDGVHRQFLIEDGKLVQNVSGQKRTVLTGIWDSDPYKANIVTHNRGSGMYMEQMQSAGAAYPVFEASGTGFTRELTMTLVLGKNGARDETVVARKRERIFLRNTATSYTGTPAAPGTPGAEVDVNDGGDWKEDPGNPPPPKPPPPPPPPPPPKPPTPPGPPKPPSPPTPKPPTPPPPPKPPTPPKPPPPPPPKKPIAAF